MNLIRLPISLFALVLLAHAHASDFDDYSNTYASTFTHGLNSPVYKFIDSSGKVTYSSSLPDDFVHAEEVSIDAAPDEALVEDTRQRHQRISESAQALSQARAQREHTRAELEKQQLERLALLQQAKPQRVYETTTIISRPYNPWLKRHRGSYHHHGQPVTLPSKGRGPDLMPLPPSSFPSMF